MEGRIFRPRQPELPGARLRWGNPGFRGLLCRAPVRLAQTLDSTRLTTCPRCADKCRVIQDENTLRQEVIAELRRLQQSRRLRALRIPTTTGAYRPPPEEPG